MARAPHSVPTLEGFRRILKIAAGAVPAVDDHGRFASLNGLCLWGLNLLRLSKIGIDLVPLCLVAFYIIPSLDFEGYPWERGAVTPDLRRGVFSGFVVDSFGMSFCCSCVCVTQCSYRLICDNILICLSILLQSVDSDEMVS